MCDATNKVSFIKSYKPTLPSFLSLAGHTCRRWDTSHMVGVMLHWLMREEI